MSDDVKETLDATKEEIKSAISSRFNSPFLGAFIISWLAWNHRLIFVLFSSMSVDERFHYIDERLYPTLTAFLAFNLGGPLLSALGYIFLMPWPTEGVHRWNLKMKERLRNAERVSQGSTLLSQTESDELRANVEAKRKIIVEQRGKLRDLARQRAALRALTVRNEPLEVANRFLEDYLKSQPFNIGKAQYGITQETWKFLEDGAIEGNKVEVLSQWFVVDGVLVLLFGADDVPERCDFVFDVADHSFRGRLRKKDNVRIAGVYESYDFAAY